MIKQLYGKKMTGNFMGRGGLILIEPDTTLRWDSSITRVLESRFTDSTDDDTVISDLVVSIPWRVTRLGLLELQALSTITNIVIAKASSAYELDW